MTRNAILKRANQICDMLDKLQFKARELAMNIRHNYELREDDLTIQELEETLFDLYGFDLTDSILNAME